MEPIPLLFYVAFYKVHPNFWWGVLSL